MIVPKLDDPTISYMLNMNETEKYNEHAIYNNPQCKPYLKQLIDSGQHP